MVGSPLILFISQIEIIAIGNIVKTAMAETSLAELPKSTLLSKLQGQIAANKRAKNVAEALGDKVLDAVGTVTAAATGAIIGYAELKWADEKGPLSVGPVELPLAVSVAATALSFFGFNPGGQLTFVAAGAAGAYGAGRGRAFAVEQAAKEKKEKKPAGVGYDPDELNDAENAFLGND